MANGEYFWDDGKMCGQMLTPHSGGKPKQLVVFLHGRSGSGPGGVQLVAEKFREKLPDAVFYMPNGFEKLTGCDNNMIRQWFDIPNIGRYRFVKNPDELSTEDKIKVNKTITGCKLAAQKVNETLKNIMSWYDINLSDVYLCGISQGGYTAMDMAYYSKNLAKSGETLGGVVTFGSGMLGAHIRPDAEGFVSKPKALLIHGTEDDLVPHDLCLLTEKTLKSQGVNVQRFDISGQKHAGIDWAGANIAVQQIAKWMQEREAQKTTQMQSLKNKTSGR